MFDFSDYLEVDHVYSRTLAKGIRCLALSAANSQEGVTTIASTLAKRHAHAGKTVLLVDMNYFRPSLDEVFTTTRHEWSLGDARMQQAITEIEPNLHVLTASLKIDSSMRQSGAIANALSQWQADFDAVILDTSPLNAINRHNMPAEQLCALAQATVLVVRTACTKEADILTALAKLKNQQTEALGWVMNDVECPALGDEMIREIKRLTPYFPRLARWLEGKVKANDILNQIV